MWFCQAVGGGQKISLIMVGEGEKGFVHRKHLIFTKLRQVFFVFEYFKGLWISIHIWKETLEVWTLRILQASNSVFF